MIENYLTATQIQERLDAFNETNDWSVFDDVPPSQHVEVMYPHKIDFSKILLTTKEK
jgi:hypothetical protein